MEAMASLQVGAPSSPVCKGQAVLGDGRKSLSSNARQARAPGAAVSYRGVSVQSEQQKRKNGAVIMGQKETGFARAVSSSVSESDTSVEEDVKARQEGLQRERDSRNFRVTEVGIVAPQDWHPATVVRVDDVASGVRCITLSAECSREFVKLEKAYRKPGQLVQVKVGEDVTQVPASSAPVSDAVNYAVLYKVRGDIPAGTTKLPAYSLSAKAPVDLHVTDADSPSLFNVEEGSEVQLGPFVATGLDLRPIMFLSRYPTILLFAQGKGIAVGRAILEAKDADAGTLNLGLRTDVRLYYSAPTPSLLAYQALYSKWEETKAVKVRTIVESSGGEDNWDGYIGSFTNLWDEDDIEYDPLTTGVVVAVESSKREEVKSLLAEAGIPESQIVRWEV